MNANEHANAEQAALALAMDAENNMSPILPVAIRVKKPGWPAIWLPLILLWPLIIAIFCLALPLSVLVPAPRRHVLAALVASYQVLCALHGTHVEVDDGSHGAWKISLY